MDEATVNYLAEYGDWVRLADGRAATVIRSQPCLRVDSGQHGTVYDLMFKGGSEFTVYHYDGDDFLTMRSLGNSPDKHLPFFTVVNQEA